MVVRIDRLVLSMELYYGSGMSKCKLLDDVLLLHKNHESKLLYCMEKGCVCSRSNPLQNGDIHWAILFTRLVNDLELESLQYFHAILYSRYIERRGEIEWHGGLLGRDLLKLNHIIESLAMQVFSPLHGEVFGR